MIETLNHSLGGHAPEPAPLLALLRAHARAPEDRVPQQELLNALYPAILPILDRAMAQTGCGTACADELLERVRVRAIEKHYLVRNARLQRILAAPSETALEVSAAVRSVLRKLASWEAARIRRRASKLTSLNASDSLEAEFEQLAAELYRADVQRRTMAETVQETLAALTRDMQTRRLASYLLEETTQEAIAALEGTHQATVSRQLRNLKRRLEHALGAEIQP